MSETQEKSGSAVRSTDGLERRRESNWMRALRRFLPVMFIAMAASYRGKHDWIPLSWLVVGYFYYWMLEEKKERERRRSND